MNPATTTAADAAITATGLLDLSARSGLPVALDGTAADVLAAASSPGWSPLRWGAEAVAPPPAEKHVSDLAPVLYEPAGMDPNRLVYAVYADVGTQSKQAEIERRGLCYVVAVIHGQRLGGDECGRTHGHVNGHAQRTSVAFPEVLEIWRGRALVYLQAGTNNEAGGDVVTLELAPGDKAVVPPGWATVTANLSDGEALVLGKWRARASAPQYEPLRALGGMAHHVLAGSRSGGYDLEPNTRYRSAPIPRRLDPADHARRASALGLSFGSEGGEPMFTTFHRNPTCSFFDAPTGLRHGMDDAALVGALGAIVGPANVALDETRRAQTATSWYPLDTKAKQQAGTGSAPPFLHRAVVSPGDANEIAAIVHWANETRTPLVPVGGSSNTVAANRPVPATGGSSVAVSLARLQDLSLDADSLLCRVGAGHNLHELEEALNRHDYTLGHVPQSLYLATVGGSVATNASACCRANTAGRPT
jgi:oxalate decarboxylase/phosphoglucose isomerase-like protein (cupin superfamily)